MPETVSYDAQHGLIRVRAWGHGTISEWRASLREFQRLYRAHGVTRILIDVREQVSTPGTVDLFDFATEFPPGIFKVAILPSESSRAQQAFLGTVAVNRGRHFESFENEAKALAWLGVAPASQADGPPELGP